MTDLTIDKRTFLAALPCHTAGWHGLRAERDKMTPALEWMFYGGNQVGDAARAQLGEGIMLPFAPRLLAQETTQRMLANPGSKLLFEASLQSGPFVARADALRRAGDRWELIEFKSAKEPKDGHEVGDDYLDDLAFTALVAKGAGLPLGRCILMLLSRSYRLGDDAPILVEYDMTERVAGRVDELAIRASAIAGDLTAAEQPVAELKLICGKCSSFTLCFDREVSTTIFILPALSQKRFDNIKPVINLSDLPADADLTANQRALVEMIRSDSPRVMDGLSALDSVAWPAYYLDFETVSPVMPWFEEDGMYAQRPFQYSIHVCDALGRVTGHLEYLAPCEGDWRRDLAEQLLDALGTEGSIIVYTDFEERELRRLAELFPDLTDRIDAAIRRLVDLHEIVKRGYAHPGFLGRTSIKKVLPVMVPDLVGYSELAINEGQSASGSFGLMRVGKYDTATFDERRRDLLAYCKLDTLAMVRVHEALERVRDGHAVPPAPPNGK